MRPYAPLPPDTFDRISGLETLRGIVEGRLPPPPMAETMNIDLIEVEEGRVVFAGTPLEAHLNPAGAVHGGWMATILDSALGCAAHSTLAAGERYTSVEMKVSFLRPPRTGEGGRLLCEGKVINRGKTLALVEARLVDASGKLYAHGTETCMIFSKG